MCELKALMDLWTRILGEPPTEQQFLIWGELYPVAIIRKGVLKTGIKNQNLSGTMTQDHRLRFANRVMQSAAKDVETHAANRARLSETTGVTEGSNSTRGSNA
jgi:hypothetical protein